MALSMTDAALSHSFNTNSISCLTRQILVNHFVAIGYPFNFANTKLPTKQIQIIYNNIDD